MHGRMVDLQRELGIAEILCSIRLVLEAKTGKEIKQVKLKFLEVFSEQFCFIRIRRQHLRAVE